MKHRLAFPCRWAIVSLAIALFTVPVLNCGAQDQPPIIGQRPPRGEVPPPPEDDVWQQQQRKEMEKKANLQRQEEIKKDSEKLLELATELKQSVDKSSENTLSLEVIKKAEQIEKLAKTVKEKMKGP
jgi:hypothetical protein